MKITIQPLGTFIAFMFAGAIALECGLLAISCACVISGTTVLIFVDSPPPGGTGAG